jgi:hypothetical protein
MTAIAGFVHDGHVYIGGDSAGVGGLHLTVRADSKVFKNGDFLFGFTSSFRMGQLLRYAFVPPTPKEGQEAYAFMVTSFIDAVRSCLKSGGFAERDKEAESGGTFLVGYRGRLFIIYDDYQVGESLDGYDACGCGDSYCKGVLFATANIGMEPTQRLNLALAAAERHSAGVRGPFHLEYI